MALINNNNNFNFNFDNFSLGNIGKKKESRNCPQCGYIFNGIVAVWIFLMIGCTTDYKTICKE